MTREEQLVLASGSPRRIEMFRRAGLEPLVRKSDFDERLPQGLGPRETVMYLALSKALCVERSRVAGYIIGADTVVFQERILGKPAGFEEAMEMLDSLRGKRHLVLTGVAILKSGTDRRRVFCETTEVEFKEYARADMERYVRTGEPFDKAGGYAIQGGFGKYIKSIAGDYDNVVGFPFQKAMKELENMGFRGTKTRPEGSKNETKE